MTNNVLMCGFGMCPEDAAWSERFFQQIANAEASTVSLDCVFIGSEEVLVTVVSPCCLGTTAYLLDEVSISLFDANL